MSIIINSTLLVNGSQGKYDSKIKNPQVRYGRNAASNFKKSLEQDTFVKHWAPSLDLTELDNLSGGKFDKKLNEVLQKIDTKTGKKSKCPPINFKIMYSKKHVPGKVNKNSLMGFAYELLGKRTSISVKELNEEYSKTYGNITRASAFDLNHDDKIDIAEYSTTILLSDILSTDEKSINFNNANGIITNKGDRASLFYASTVREKQSREIYQSLYDAYDLGTAQKRFIKNGNNLVS